MPIILLLLGAFFVYMIQEILYLNYWKKGLSANVTFSEQEVKEGETCHLQEIITNRKLLPLPTLLVKFQLDGKLVFLNKENTSKTDKFYRSDVIAVMPYQRVTRQLEVLCPKRGYYTISSIDLVANNLFLTRMLVDQVKTDSSLYVLPAASTWKGLKIPFEQMEGKFLTNRFLQEDPFEFRGIRPYQTYDSMKKINWKASAKAGELLVNQYFETNRQEVVLLLNLEKEGALFYEALLEESIRIAATLFEWFQNRGILVSLRTNGKDCITKHPIKVDAGAGSGHIAYCKRQLSRIDLTIPTEEFFLFFQKQSENEIPILISYAQREKLQEAFLQAIAKTQIRQWIVPIHHNMERKAKKELNPYYLEVERI